MATLQAPRLVTSSPSLARRFHASLQAPANPRTTHLSIPKLPTSINVEEVSLRSIAQRPQTQKAGKTNGTVEEETLVSKMYAILEAVVDRAEMHAVIGQQRDNWNTLLLNSINSITLAASAMAGASAIISGGTPHLAFKISSALLYSAATGMMLVVNKIQPSQLAEEQRNATRLFHQLEKKIQTNMILRSPTSADVKDAMDSVLALDKAYPLPLLPGMLDKFPKTVEPAVWWPKQHYNKQRQWQRVMERNGWSKKLEEEMMGVVGVLKRKDTAEYVRLSKLVLGVNKILAVSGPLLTGVAAFGTALMGSTHGSWPVMVGVISGALATVVNTLEHGGQVGMVFEMYRNCAGSYRRLEVEIESNLKARGIENREDGELFEMKVALQLGRSLSELKSLASASSSEDVVEFAGKLF